MHNGCALFCGIISFQYDKGDNFFSILEPNVVGSEKKENITASYNMIIN